MVDPNGAGDAVRITQRAYQRHALGWADSSVVDRAGWAESYDLLTMLASPGARVLDLGCGSGLDVPGLRQRGFLPVGLDFSMRMAALAERAFGGRIVVADIRSLPFREAAFGAVWADGSLHHVTRAELPAALQGIARVLMPGGALVLSVEAGSGDAFVTDADGIADPRFYAYYDEDELGCALDAAGFHRKFMSVRGATAAGSGFILAGAVAPGVE